MLTNYLKVAFRNITKHKLFSVINILGLTIGIAGTLFIVMYIQDELSYDRFNEKGDRIYRVNLHGKIAGQEVHTTSTAYPLYKALVEEIPEIEQATRVNDMREWIFRYEEKAFKEDKVMAVDSNFFNFFSYELVKGNPDKALQDPNSIVISELLAEKYFGDENPLDKTMAIGNDKSSYKVTGVFAEVPGNSHLKFNALLSSSSFPWMNRDQWLSNSLWTYYMINKTGNPAEVDHKMDAMIETHVSPTFVEFMGKSLAEFRNEGGIYRYWSIPLYDIHLKSSLRDEPEPPGSMSYIWIMTVIGIFIMVIACINFMNLTTAKSAGRAKEVGLRKTLGSLRTTLIGQFLTESVAYTLIGAVLAMGVVYALMPLFNEISGKELQASQLLNINLLGILFAVIIFVGLLAGSYPALYLTSFKITEVLKGKLRAGMKSGGVRSFLVTFQFWISIVLIICTAIVYQQLKYVQNQNLGFDKDHILLINDASRLDKNQVAFKNELRANTNIAGVSYSNNTVPGVNNTTIFRGEGDAADHMMSTYYADYDHLKALDLKLVEGRFFSRDFPSDSNAVVINEAAVREMGWQDPLSEKIIDFNGDSAVSRAVIGVVKDYNYESLKFNVRPLVLHFTNTGNVLYVRIAGDDPGRMVADITNAWDKYMTGDPLSYSFLDEDYDALFRSEQRLGKVFTVFTVLAIFIACLGLFGLAAFMAEQRTKEIGIRKVLGASVWSITSLMSAEFTKLVLIAFVLAIYPAYYVMDSWLEGFANKVEISYWIFALGGLSALLISWLTVSYQSLKAAKVDPVRSLKYE
ncbi:MULTISPECIES: ABC transporter permease [Fulvivirga]|uniref:ABC transporter permease n=1 Tax=Fulvivirga sediminis TaxID=2803949 RepID=A0A937FBB2_9BACT|nr:MULTISPECIES: ABC transporter permease [Fulvivirga]MBL3657433.1 ABC transporter permease [Fulvivirga sediminis]UII26605.1 ABC transporter permease [Fulvivirga maritima]